MATISAEFSHWDGDRAYIDYLVDGLDLGVHYYTQVVKGLPDECHVVGSWGFYYDPKYKMKTGYVRGYKIDDGDITLTLALILWVDIDEGVCWEGDYHSEMVVASTTVYIPKKTVPCPQTFKVIDVDTAEPVSGVSVMVLAGDYPECTTGADGKCSILSNYLISGETYDVDAQKGTKGGATRFVHCEEDTVIIYLGYPCPTEGETMCVGPDLVECHAYRWVLLEANSPECLPACEDYDNQTDCEAAGCYWFNDSCHTEAPTCSELNNQSDCERFGCYWWSDGTCHDTEEPECEEGAHEVLEYCPDGVTEKRWRDCINGEWVEDSRVCPCFPEGAHEVLEYCPDGVTEKRWRDCVSGKWVEGSQACPSCIEGEQKVIEYCPDGVTRKQWWECIEGEWKWKSQKCPPVEGDRKCINFDLYEYQSGEWVLIKKNAFAECLPCPFAVIAQGTDLVDFLGPLRAFRDNVLKQSYVGRKFVKFYYGKLTPFLSPILLRHVRLKRLIRPFVRILVWLIVHKRK